MKRELKKILEDIEKIYDDPLIEKRKDDLVRLWTKYYQLSHSSHIDLPQAYDLYLLGENMCYIMDCKLNYQKNLEVPINEISNLKSAIKNNKEFPDSKQGITTDEANKILTWIVNRTWKNLSHLGIDIEINSLNGFCELAQVSSIYPLEEIGLDVTKNSAENSFDYKFHHTFGTVNIPITDGSNVTDTTYLLDPTYKQFFTTVRCNFGRYYAKEENTGEIVAPDPGYFMRTKEEIEVSEEIVKNGFCLLNEETAKVYGGGFRKASISLKDFSKFDEVNKTTGKEYMEKIKNTSTDYYTQIEEVSEIGYAFDLEIPETNDYKKILY